MDTLEEKAKQKAQELIDKYYCIADEYVALGDYEKLQLAKQCALIAVEEAQKAEYNVLMKFGFVTEKYEDYQSPYRNEVKKHLK